ncbi:MAG TPA: hypothetical protein PK072_01730 [Quisquiliibacterium sp.]|nr:hypothetical protein [Quisquiliibacterium sp.]HQP65344.1 hypothetical protein [Quisquiliibacterium sp.]
MTVEAVTVDGASASASASVAVAVAVASMLVHPRMSATGVCRITSGAMGHAINGLARITSR